MSLVDGTEVENLVVYFKNQYAVIQIECRLTIPGSRPPSHRPKKSLIATRPPKLSTKDDKVVTVPHRKTKRGIQRCKDSNVNHYHNSRLQKNIRWASFSSVLYWKAAPQQCIFGLGY